MHSGGFIEFYFCVVYPRLGAEEAGNLKMPKGTDKKSLSKSLPCLAKRPEKMGRKL